MKYTEANGRRKIDVSEREIDQGTGAECLRKLVENKKA